MLYGLNVEQIQRLFDDMIKPYAEKGKVKIIYADCTYLYQFAPDDVWKISKLSELVRYGSKKVFENGRWVMRNPMALEWHRLLERWYSDQTVIDSFHRPFKPMAIRRALDKVPNEGLESLAGSFIGEDSVNFKIHGMGKGFGLTQAFASDTKLVDEIERIDVTGVIGGGSVSRDGSVIYVVGNHDIDMPGDGDKVTETALFDTLDGATDDSLDLCGDHSVFPDGIPHQAGEDAMGSTTVIFPCST